MPVSKNRRKNKRKPAPAARKKPAPEPVSEPAPLLPDRRALEGVMAKLAGGLSSGFDGSDGDDAALWQAQELMYEAWDAGAKRERIALAKRALDISELCADAHVLLAEEVAKTLVEARRHYEAGVAAGERALGAQAFERDAGHFWGLLETRPYMRARAGLAECLWQAGGRAAAIGHYRDMLRLNPNDNQGLRHVLTSWLLTTGDHGALEELLAAYDDDVFAEWAYAKTLLALRKGDEADARAALAAAWKRNPHVPALLTGATPIPEHQDDHYTLGSPDEAVIYVLQNRENWTATRGALQWLAETVQTLPPPDEKRP